MESLHSVSELIQELHEGNSDAGRQLYERFVERMISAARWRLGNIPKRAIDEEDVALSAFDAFLRGVKENRFKRLADRDDLWQVLSMLTERNAIAVRRHTNAKKRGGAMVRGESVFADFLADCSVDAGGGIAEAADPNPDAIDHFTIGVRELLQMLDDENQRQVAILRLEGLTNKEISEQLDISLRAVERKVQLIRKRWENHWP